MDKPLFFGWVRNAARGLATGSLLLALLGYVYFFGLRSIPWLSEDSSTQIAGSLLQAIPNTRYHKVIGTSELRPVLEVMADVGFDIHLPPDRFEQETVARFLHGGNVYVAAQPFSIAVSRGSSASDGYRMRVLTYAFGETVTESGVGIARAELDRTASGWRVGPWHLPPAKMSADSPETASVYKVFFGSAVIWDTTKSTYWYYDRIRNAHPTRIRGRVTALGDPSTSFLSGRGEIRSFDSTNASHLKMIAVFEQFVVVPADADR